MGVTVLPGLHFNPKTFNLKNETNKLNAVLTNLSAQTVIVAKNSIVALAESVDETNYDTSGSMFNTLTEQNWIDESRLNKILSDLTVEEQN